MEEEHQEFSGSLIHSPIFHSQAKYDVLIMERSSHILSHALNCPPTPHLDPSSNLQSSLCLDAQNLQSIVGI